MSKKTNPDIVENVNSQLEGDAVDVGTAEDVDNLMRKYDKESQTRIWEGTPAIVVRAIMVCFSLYCIYSTLFSVAALEKRMTAFLALVVIMGYLTYPASKHHVRHNYIPWYDFVLMALGAGSFLYYCFSYDSLVRVLTSAARISTLQIVIGIVGILCLIELCRRCVGIPILCVAGALIAYTFITLSSNGTVAVALKRMLYTLFYTTSGIMATPVQVCAKYIVVFIIFGAFLERTGIAAFFISLANSLVGGLSGGPAKVAVISSALCGMVSGSSVGNTVTTGSVTIPMMKKTGYKGEFAGAVEAAASTGGQIMPPIMGAAAFLMAEYMNVTYGEVALRAILPAVLYFAGIFIAVHLEAKKLGLKGIDRSELPRILPLMKKSYLLLPLIVLVALVTTNTRTMQFSASIAIICSVVVSLFDKDNRITLSKIFEALEAGGKSTITVAVACSMAGIISGCITATGLASKLISAVVSASEAVKFIDPTFVALFLTMLCCIILGMGVPTTANYCIMASTCAPILITIGVPKMAAHFFVFYFGIVADITPPVALAAYAGSAIAKSNPMKTGINATKLAIGAFIVPYIFCMNPAMLLIDVTAWSMIQIIITSFVGMFGVAAALEGYLLINMHWITRIMAAAGGLLMMIPGSVTDFIGIGLLVVVLLIEKFGSKKLNAVV
ncbi:MAG: TRAP transporter permease [Oscillospiraceae bacterium]|nr:TRAP transporter permease [Oscillospiraceae bacterium]